MRWLVEGQLGTVGVEVSYRRGHEGRCDSEHECGTHGDGW